MALDVILLILFVILIIFILFREEIFSLFKNEPKLERRDSDNRETKKTPQKQKSQTKNRTQKPTPPQKSFEIEEKERIEREKKRREANAKAFAEQQAAKDTLAKKEAEKKDAARKIAAKKAAQELEMVKKAELAKKEAAEAKQKASKEALAKKEAQEKAAAERIVAEKAAKELEEAKKTELIKKEFPKGDYSDFSNSRLLDMGLSQADADTFILELIEQVDDHIPLLEAAIEAGEYEQIERLTHSVKGSATNLGTGGVADVMIDFNTYCKSGTDKEIILAHLNNLKAYQEKLKSQFS